MIKETQVTQYQVVCDKCGAECLEALNPEIAKRFAKNYGWEITDSGCICHRCRKLGEVTQ